MRQERILIIKLGALGDVVQAEGAYRDIRAHHPEATIIALTAPAYRRFFERCPWVDQVESDPRAPRWHVFRMAALRERLRKLNVDMVYDLQQVKRTHFYFRWFLPDVDWLGKAPGCKFRFSHIPGRCALDQFHDQFGSLNIPNNHVRRADLGWMADDMTGFMDAAGVKAPYVVLIPGASAGHDAKRWPFYDALAGWLVQRGITPVTVPGPDEMELCRSYHNAVMLADGDDYLDFFKLAGVLKEAEFVVGNDTGPMHIAANLQRPGLALYGNSSATMTGIQHSRIAWLEVDSLPELPLASVQQELEERFFFSGQKDGA